MAGGADGSRDWKELGLWALLARWLARMAGICLAGREMNAEEGLIVGARKEGTDGWDFGML